MHKRILVAIDDSDTSEFVFIQAINLAKECKVRLNLLHVLPAQVEHSSPLERYLSARTDSDTTSNSTHGQLSNSTQTSSEDKILGLLVGCSERAKTLQVDTEYTLIMGNPGETICEVALSWRADLILLGGKEKTNNGASSQDSVRNVVTHNAPCSVEVVRLQSNSVLSSSLENEMLLAHLAGWQ